MTVGQLRDKPLEFDDEQTVVDLNMDEIEFVEPEKDGDQEVIMIY